MIRIRSAALGAALVLGLAATAEAQSGQGEKPRGDRPRAEQGGRRGNAGMGQALLRGIELTDAQKAQLKDVHARHVDERQALRRSQGEGRPDSTEMAAMRSLAERQAAAVRAILTPAQQATFDRNVAEVRERREERGEGQGERRGGRRGGRGQGQPKIGR